MWIRSMFSSTMDTMVSDRSRSSYESFKFELYKMVIYVQLWKNLMGEKKKGTELISLLIFKQS